MRSKIVLPISFLILCNSAISQEKEFRKDTILVLEPVELKATRAGKKDPFTQTSIYSAEIEKLNTGQDLPFLLNHQPGVIVHSDAGNGIGYTGIRIRGTDASRINVTLNGIPFNDAESQGTFFVDLPDFISSVGSIQVQRGVGTSSNGAAAFGATINISTNELNRLPYAEFNNSFGSFHSRKHTFKTGSGLIGDRFTTDLRISHISSDGYIDRASSDLSSYFFSAAYSGKKTMVRYNQFSGKERTYQAWYGVSESDLEHTRTINYAGTEKPGEPYDNEIDNYKQDHHQLFFTSHITQHISFNTALFYVRGKGFYEQYKASQAYSDYGLTPPDPLTTTSDMVRQLWLDNHFYGNIFSLLYNRNATQFTLGGGWNEYDGKHFGEITWAENGIGHPARWYDNDALKNDLNIYIKQLTAVGKHFHLFYDLQLRKVRYKIDGFRNNPDLQVNNRYTFFNPKTGISYSSRNSSAYISYARGQKEPNRDDFETAMLPPTPEKLDDIELGYSSTGKYKWSIVLYYMNYKDQLVLTGKINDVGAYTRTNIPESYRLGAELSATIIENKFMKAAFNLAFSRNKVNELIEFVDDYDNGGQSQFTHQQPDIAFSPSVVGSSSVTFYPTKDLEIGLFSKYVSKQYLDNTQNEARKLDAFHVHDARIFYKFKIRKIKEVSIMFQVNNLLNALYEPNGYSFSYISGGKLVTENYYYPMAGRNFMAGINIKL